MSKRSGASETGNKVVVQQKEQMMKMTMSNRWVISSLIGLLVVSSVQAGTITWDSTNATSTSWALGSNWLGGIAPVNGDDVIVNADGTYDPTDYNGAELNSLTLEGGTNLSISGVKVGAGGVSNNAPGRSFFLTGTTTLLADSIWGGIRTIFTDQVTGNFKITANGNAARFETNSPAWTGGLDVRTDAAMANNFAAGTITPWGTGTITMINQKLDGETNTNARLNFASNANNITPATAYVLANDIVLSDPGTLNYQVQQATNMAAAGAPHYYVLSGNITGAVNSARTLSFNNIYASAATTPAIFTLTGTNTYAAQTLVGANTTLQIATGGSIASDTSVAAGAAIGGGGTITGNLTLEADAKFFFGGDTLSVTGNVAFGNAATFGVDDLIADDWSSFAAGTYTLIDTTATDFSTLGLANWGEANAGTLADGRRAYFENGSLSLVIIPEPSAIMLLGVGVTLLAGRRRRTC